MIGFADPGDGQRRWEGEDGQGREPVRRIHLSLLGTGGTFFQGLSPCRHFCVFSSSRILSSRLPPLPAHALPTTHARTDVSRTNQHDRITRTMIITLLSTVSIRFSLDGLTDIGALNVTFTFDIFNLSRSLLDCFVEYL